jgi:hypothetical protein
MAPLRRALSSLRRRSRLAATLALRLDPRGLLPSYDLRDWRLLSLDRPPVLIPVTRRDQPRR